MVDVSVGGWTPRGRDAARVSHWDVLPPDCSVHRDRVVNLERTDPHGRIETSRGLTGPSPVRVLVAGRRVEEGMDGIVGRRTEDRTKGPSLFLATESGGGPTEGTEEVRTKPGYETCPGPETTVSGRSRPTNN